MRTVLVVLTFALLCTCTSVYADNDPTAEEITQAKNDPEKDAKITLILYNTRVVQ